MSRQDVRAKAVLHDRNLSVALTRSRRATRATLRELELQACGDGFSDGVTYEQREHLYNMYNFVESLLTMAYVRSLAGIPFNPAVVNLRVKEHDFTIVIRGRIEDTPVPQLDRAFLDKLS